MVSVFACQSVAKVGIAKHNANHTNSVFISFMVLKLFNFYFFTSSLFHFTFKYLHPWVGMT